MFRDPCREARDAASSHPGANHVLVSWLLGVQRLLKRIKCQPWTNALMRLYGFQPFAVNVDDTMAVPCFVIIRTPS